MATERRVPAELAGSAGWRARRFRSLLSHEVSDMEEKHDTNPTGRTCINSETHKLFNHEIGKRGTAKRGQVLIFKAIC
ncbi:hypothetical protein NDU88_001446 [Pleurodeles waltl]|uniref:Uncharacterized protein n=1 Tax=Pleurodeles waltl TaxID=8319 RepID=A0AAV7KR00_PLEWA|nr:hypothetical protein NDU88_001446 [Pleurodeles waltl]